LVSFILFPSPARSYVKIFLHKLQDRYLASAREIIRINGTTKAPIMNYAAETSQGVVTVRAFGKVDQFFSNYLKLVDNDAKLFFYSNVAEEWLLLRIEALQNFTLFAASFLLILLPEGFVSPGRSPIFHQHMQKDHGEKSQKITKAFLCLAFSLFCRICGPLSIICSLIDRNSCIYDSILLQDFKSNYLSRKNQAIHAHKI